jgi:putative colanic acid biosynthesis acetyltransferase WcaF
MKGSNKQFHHLGAVCRFLIRGIDFLEYLAVYWRGKLTGISSVMRYLRNPNPSVTRRVLIAFGATVGTGVVIKRSLLLDNVYTDENSTGDFSHLRIGNNCYIGDSVYFDLANEISFADDAVVSGRASFITHADCRRSSYLSRCFPRKCAPIVVETGAWVAFGAAVLAGVTLGKNSVVGANSVAMQDAEPYWMYVGTPARKFRRVDARLHDEPSSAEIQQPLHTRLGNR